MRLPWQAMADDEWSLDRVVRPWPRDRPAIFEFLSAERQRESDSEETLPDEDWAATMPGARFVAGLFDRIVTVHEELDEAARQSKEILRAIHELAARSTARNLQALNEAVVSTRSHEALELALDSLPDETHRYAKRIRDIGRLLMTEAPDRDVVKLGILLAGTTPLDPSTLDPLLRLGRHAEFTRYVVAVSRAQDPEWVRHIWELAQATTGWGRHEAVLHLDGVSDPEIREWLLEEGWQGHAGGEEVALICARTGDLLGAMVGSDIEILRRTRGILHALILSESRGSGLSSYEDGGRVLERYIEILTGRTPTLALHNEARFLRHYLDDDDREWPEAPAWAKAQRRAMIGACNGILVSADWEALTQAALKRPAPEVDYEAVAAAQHLTQDTFPYWWQRLQAGHLEDAWNPATYAVKEDRIDDLLAFAVANLPLGELATGATTELFGFGPEYRPHNDLGDILAALKRFPGRGWRLIHAGIASPLVRNRLAAVAAIENWPREDVTDEMIETVGAAEAVEPDPEVRNELAHLLAKFAQGGGGSARGDSPLRW